MYETAFHGGARSPRVVKGAQSSIEMRQSGQEKEDRARSNGSATEMQ